MNELTIFKYEEKEVRTIVGEDGEPWWVAKDVCDVLAISKHRDAITRLKDSQKSQTPLKLDGWSQSRHVSIINESGLYKLIMRSNKPNAEKFQDWIAEEVLPSIRKTGGIVQTIGDNLKREEKTNELIKIRLGGIVMACSSRGTILLNTQRYGRTKGLTNPAGKSLLKMGLKMLTLNITARYRSIKNIFS